MDLQQRTALVPDWPLITLAKGTDFKQPEMPIREVAYEVVLRLRRFAIAMPSPHSAPA